MSHPTAKIICHIAILTSASIACKNKKILLDSSKRGSDKSGHALIRLSNIEYLETLQAAFPQLDLTKTKVNLQEDFSEGRFSTTDSVSEAHLRKYYSAAQRIAQHIAKTPRIVPCEFLKTSCHEKIIEKLWRRKLTDEDRDSLKKVISTPELTTNNLKVEGLIFTLLVSPDFLLHHENLSIYDSSDVAVPHRISYRLFNKPANQKHLNMGVEITKKENIEDLISQNENVVLAKLEEFLKEWLNLRNYKERMTKADPSFTPLTMTTLYKSMKKQLLIDFFQGKTSYDELLTTKNAYVNKVVAPYMGIDDNGPTLKLAQIDRKGIFSHPFFMALTGQREDVNFIKRGVYLLRNALGFTIESAPAFDQEVKMKNKQENKGEVTITSLREETEQGTCLSCHVYINPVGLSALGYDNLGRKVTSPINESMTLTGLTTPVTFKTFDQLQTLLAEDEENGPIYRHFALSLFEFYLGRKATGKEADAVTEEFVSSGFHLKKFLLGILIRQGRLNNGT